MLLEGKVAIVSGIGPGMGRDISLLFAEHGADLVLGARTRRQVRGGGRGGAGARAARPRSCALDITDADSCVAAVATAAVVVRRRRRPRQQRLPGRQPQDLRATPSLDEWKATMDVNLWGTLQMTEAVGAGDDRARRRATS